jgi:hypothetical protein
MPRIKRLLIFSAAAFLFAIAAFAISIWRISPLLALNDNCRTLRVDLGIPATIPNCEGVRAVAGSSAPIHFNALGYRDKARGPRAPGTVRVAFLGGSTALGFGLTDEQSPAWRVEELLRKAGVTNVEFMNLSSEGYEAIRHSLRIFEYLKTLHPDIVLVDTLRADKMVTDFIDWQEGEINENGRVKRIRSLRDFAGGALFDWIGMDSAAGLWLRQMYTGYRLFLSAFALHSDPQKTRGMLIRPQIHAYQAIASACEEYACEARVLWDPLEGTPGDVNALTHWLFGYDIDYENIRDSFERNKLDLLDVSGLKPRGSEPALFQGRSRYYTVEGMERYSQALASAVSKVVKQ